METVFTGNRGWNDIMNTSHLAKRGVAQEIMAARLSILVFEEDVFHANMNATAIVHTALRRKSIETLYSRMTEEEAAEMDEAQSL